ncbi:MAG: glutamate racemase [Chloroflexota bacterium]|nr:glutamate racemase [Chloroflexota bacterium]
MSGTPRPATVQPTPAGPVGVFDSGVGGLTVLRDLLRELPDERYSYFGDTGNCPYGVRPESEITQLSLNGAAFLLGRGAKIIVVACNTASSAAIGALRAAFPQVKFVAVVPAVKPAAAMTRTGHVAIAATTSAAHSAYLRGLIQQFAQGVEVYPVGCQRLVALAEDGQLDGPEVEREIRRDIEPLLAKGIDVLALGCTHFPAMRPVFERVVGPDVRVIDSGAAVARQTRRVLTAQGLLATPGSGPAAEPRPPRPDDEFWRSGPNPAFERVAGLLLGAPVEGRYAPEMLWSPESAV